jgi:hypothetical protein
MSKDDTIHGSTSSFELAFHKALEAARQMESKIEPKGGKVFYVPTQFGGNHTYEFRPTSDVRGHLPRKFEIMGPILNRAGRMTSFGQLGSIDIATGKMDLWRGNPTARMTMSAVAYFLRTHGDLAINHLGWDAILHEGWGYILKRTSPDISRGKKEVALISAQAPGQKLVLYTPDGKRRLNYTEEQKVKIPIPVLSSIRKEFKNAGIWEHLVQSYVTISRNFPERKYISAWEEGPGSKYDWSRVPSSG